MNGVFVFLINGNLETFYDFNDIPKNFDHVIKFLPDIPDPPIQETSIEKFKPGMIDYKH